MSGLYATDGSINVTVVDGSSFVGLYAADGSYNVILSPNVIDPSPINTVAPVESGTETSGSTLSVTDGTWLNSPASYTYQWLQAVVSGGVVVTSGGEPIGVNISGATSSTYTLQSGDVGQQIFCNVTATNAAGSATKVSNVSGAIASGEDTATTSWAAAVVSAGGTVSSGRRTLVNNLIVSLKSAGVYTKIDRLYLFAGENTQSALCDLISDAVATTGNGPTFTIDRGFTGALGGGTSPFVDSGLNPASATNYTQNSASIGGWTLTNTGSTTNMALGGWLDSTATNWGAMQYQDSGSALGGLNESFPGGTTVTHSGAAFFVANRSASNAEQLYINGSSAATGTNASAAIANTASIYFLSVHFNANGTIRPSDDQLAVGLIGGSLTGTEQTNVYNALQTYLHAVGAV